MTYWSADDIILSLNNNEATTYGRNCRCVSVFICLWGQFYVSHYALVEHNLHVMPPSTDVTAQYRLHRCRINAFYCPHFFLSSAQGFSVVFVMLIQFCLSHAVSFHTCNLLSIKIGDLKLNYHLYLIPSSNWDIFYCLLYIKV